MIKRTAQIISALFHPVFIPVYSLIFLFNYPSYLSLSIQPPAWKVAFVIVIATTFFLPLVTALFLRQRKKIQSLEMEDASERHLPFISSAIYYFTGYFLINQPPLPVFFGRLLLGAAASVILAGMINFRWKISIHMIGLGGFTGMLLGLTRILYTDLTLPVIIAFLIAGIVGTSRLLLNAHTQSQVYAGFVLGTVVMYLILLPGLN